MIGTDAHRIVHKETRHTPGSRFRRTLAVLLVAVIVNNFVRRRAESAT